MTSVMEFVADDEGGGVRCIDDEALDLRAIGTLQLTRVSHAEPDAEGYRWADTGHRAGRCRGWRSSSRRSSGRGRLKRPTAGA
ncbi:MAG: hypothetical protein ACKOYJ_01560 [Planctomycetia bacterium]